MCISTCMHISAWLSKDIIISEVANPSKKKRENSKQNLKQTRKLSVTEQSPISGILIRKVTKSHNSTPDVKCSSELCGDIDSM